MEQYSVIYTGTKYSNLEFGKSYIVIAHHRYGLKPYYTLCDLSNNSVIQSNYDLFFLESEFDSLKGYRKLKLNQLELCSKSEIK